MTEELTSEKIKNTGKVEMLCNQCSGKVKWFESNPDEVAMKKVGRKYYCYTCLKKLAHLGVDLT